MVRHLFRRLKKQSDDDARSSRRSGRVEPFGPEMVGAIILLGYSLASRNGLVERIEASAPVVIVEVPQADRVEPIAPAIGVGFGTQPLPSETKRFEPHPLHDVPTVVAPWARGRHYDCDDAQRTVRTLRDHYASIGMTCSVDPSLPSDLLHACEERIVVSCLDPHAVELLIELIVGEKPDGRLETDAAAAVEAADLRVTVHHARGSEGSVHRLAAVQEGHPRRSRSVEAPRLQDFAGYGPVLDRGLSAAADLAAFAGGAIPWFACEQAILLAGEPGTGKSSFPGASAQRAGVPLVAGSLARRQGTSDAPSGTTLQVMRAFFEVVRKAAPCIALIDELDSFGDRRKSTYRDRDYWTLLVDSGLETQVPDARLDAVPRVLHEGTSAVLGGALGLGVGQYAAAGIGWRLASYRSSCLSSRTATIDSFDGEGFDAVALSVLAAVAASLTDMFDGSRP